MLFVPCLAFSAEIPMGADGFASNVQSFVATYCIRCHGTEKRKGDMTLHDLRGDFSTEADLDRWEQVLEKLEDGQMPPEDERQPTDAERTAIVDWIDRELKHVATESPGQTSAPAVRRLTNLEYQSTISDLLGFEFDVADDLPEDPEKFYDFRNTAELMRIGPERLDRYMEIARRAMKSAIVDLEKPEVFKVRREWSSAGIDRGMGQDEVGIWGNRRNCASDGIRLNNFPKTGQYRIRMQASAVLPDGHSEAPLNIDMGTPPGRTQTPFKTVATLYLTNNPDDPQIFEFTGRVENHPYITTRTGKGGNGGELVDQMSIIPRLIFDDGTLNDGYGNARQLEFPRAVINWIEFEAPVVDVWPPEHHKAILFASPLKESDPAAYVREVLTRFMSRAYRRPATESEVERFSKIYDLVRANVESKEEAFRETLAMVLVSPQFLYHNEWSVDAEFHHAMASRLSYFLWASMPDPHLLELAANQKLDDPAVIQQQVIRMLGDEKAHRFIEEFTLQWLSIRKMRTVPINRDLFPRFLYTVSAGETAGTEVPYRPTVRDYMLQETVEFFGEMIDRNASAMAVVDSDFAVLNERLAAHYGVQGVHGMQLRPVDIEPKHQLGGLMTQGSVLIGNGTGTAPHPIYRAVWLREAILGDDVPPPPSEVPALSETAGDSVEKAISIADLLAKHRNTESCNECHVRLDPWGIPFEQYNAVGQFQPRVPKDGVRVRRFDEKVDRDLSGYRRYLESINVVEVEATARVPGGPEVEGIEALKEFLIDVHKEEIAENIIRRLLSYAAGRKLTYRDRSTVEAIMSATEQNSFGTRDILISICLSDIFREKYSEDED
ncbi:DUF1592 domain-containing protein [Bremerella sp. P1]|uniref:DUF1592 domain-containing protein n=1 Tax=Bremerella sp. P1 TaxID=3026424 RepID=UPI002368BFEC|nr:DUF1592 domain-containing protein [Bremerella sp. P1]WDI41627.1 DUF1592 domain-containing protein [Bremerella sp. P1]